MISFSFSFSLVENSLDSYHHIPYALLASHLNPSNSIVRFMVGRCYRLLKRPLPSIFYFLSSIALTSPTNSSTTSEFILQELHGMIAHYRSQYIRLQTTLDDEVASPSPRNGHPMIHTRLCVFGFARILEQLLLQDCLQTMDSVLRQQENHLVHVMKGLDCTMEEADRMTTSNLVYMVLIGVVFVDMMMRKMTIDQMETSKRFENDNNDWNHSCMCYELIELN